MKSKIQIKRLDGSVLFEYEDEDNCVKKVLEVYIKKERESNKGIIDLTNANLESTNLAGIDLSGTDLSYADLSDSDLTFADLHNADLTSANLHYSKLIGANLNYTVLDNTILADANLYHTDLKGANIQEAYVRLSTLNFTNIGVNTINQTLLPKQINGTFIFNVVNGKPNYFEEINLSKNINIKIKWFSFIKAIIFNKRKRFSLLKCIEYALSKYDELHGDGASHVIIFKTNFKKMIEYIK